MTPVGKETRWLRLRVKRKDTTTWNPALREAVAGGSGVYAIRDRHTREVHYVGESHTRRAWKTILHHFQGVAAFDRVGEYTHGNPGRLEIKWMRTSDADASTAEKQWIQRFAPAWNARNAKWWKGETEPQGPEPAPF